MIWSSILAPRASLAVTTVAKAQHGKAEDIAMHMRSHTHIIIYMADDSG